MKKALTLPLAALLGFGALAHAQERKDPVAVPAPEARSQIEQDIEKFWGKRRKVAVVQKRTYDAKEGRFELSVHVGYIPSDALMNYLPVGLRGAYHIKEWLGVELGFLYTDATSFKSGLAEGLETIGTEGPNPFRLTLLEKQRLFFHLNAVFSVIHGKVAVMKTGLSHFDLFLTAGPSFHIVEQPIDDAGTPVSGVGTFRVGGNIGAGFKFFINDFFGIRLDVRQYLFPKSDAAGGGLHKPTEISLGATFFAG
jgi:outer membrane beta-barrel protein